MTKAINDATLNQAGTIYQYLIALRDCFELNDGDFLEIETVGDVSVISNKGRSFQKEVKHHFGKSNLSERSIEFWKTLANWYDEYDRIKNFTNYILSTTSKINTNSKFYEWNELSKENKLAILKEIGKPIKKRETAFREHYNRIFSTPYDESKLLEILDKFSIESSKNTLDGISKEFSNYIGHIPKEKRDQYIGALLGRILIKVKDPPHKWLVTRKDFDEILQVESAAYVGDAKTPLPSLYRKINVPINELEYLHNEKFVKAIREIKYDKEVQNAISDYWKMEKTVLDYFQNDPTYCEDLENYTEDLYRRLEYEKYDKELELYETGMELDELSNTKKIIASKKFYSGVMRWNAKDFGSIIQNQDFFQRGTIHNIVNTTEFTWKVGEKKDEY